jgi:hypothetical protein
MTECSSRRSRQLWKEDHAILKDGLRQPRRPLCVGESRPQERLKLM